MNEDDFYYQEQIDILEYKIDELQETLNSIEEMCKKSLHCDTCYNILQLINEANQS